MQKRLTFRLRYIPLVQPEQKLSQKVMGGKVSLRLMYARHKRATINIAIIVRPSIIALSKDSFTLT
jgi:hypothetical protein